MQKKPCHFDFFIERLIKEIVMALEESREGKRATCPIREFLEVYGDKSRCEN